MRDAIVVAPLPMRRIVRTEIPQAARAVGITTHAADELLREPARDVGRHPQCPHSCVGQRNLQHGLRGLILLDRVGNRHARQPAARGGGVRDP